MRAGFLGERSEPKAALFERSEGSSLSPVHRTGSRANARRSSLPEHLLQTIQLRAGAGHGLEGTVKQDIVQARDAAIEAFAAGQKIAQCPWQ